MSHLPESHRGLEVRFLDMDAERFVASRAQLPDGQIETIPYWRYNQLVIAGGNRGFKAYKVLEVFRKLTHHLEDDEDENEALQEAVPGEAGEASQVD